ncbi:peptidase domain-containing ABC transporter [Bergeyella cardium]|uniref:ATP-binding cassette domain-containing protein n=1 Tax=Bergeyella cardium TaxID=1585976 RepID=A0A6P1QUB0_9FLAO|nr:peptidase domain-containing ABC transporter [Bergeyella cardium]QHN64633.1 ATP-binding cassette domain-containing protein [Bergeyella cardium]WHE33931.1 peptidase domain-containing ABC transporter [Bergeyella cardium]WHF60581.1 peptidase domain-containing ABC transporter [Bergeyella cardium]
MINNKFPSYIQPDNKDCGPTCIKIIAKYYGVVLPLQYIRDLSETDREGTSLFGLSEAAEKIGFRSLGVNIDFNTLKNEVPLPCIVHWDSAHFVVVYKINKQNRVYISDPNYGLIDYTKEDFIKHWIGADNINENSKDGIALLLETTPNLYERENTNERDNKNNFYFLTKYITKYNKLIIQLFVGLFIGSLLNMTFPFLTQSIVDIGIHNQDLNFIYLILLAQIMLFLGKTSIEVIRSWILLHISSRINISIISDFFIKLMNLPINFFDTRLTGDIMQRINDHTRIEQLLTSTSLNTLFSIVNLLTFSIILLFYNYKIFIIYLIGGLIYIIWILFFLKKRKELDYKKFSQVSNEQSKVIELINGMQEIKMNNAERQKRWDWEYLQIRLFKLKIKSLSLEQIQSVGGNFINQIKDIFISFFSSQLVLNGDLTLGMMLSVQYIIGQLNNPLLQVIDFIKQYQDAKISLERLNEIHNKDDEEYHDKEYISEIPEGDLNLKNISFRYNGSDNYIFENLNINIPYKKTTAIVGTSGSGKTTILKLLSRFYEPNSGEVKVGNINISNISIKLWRKKCGVVMQEGYIFNDTIAKNIAIGEETINKERLRNSVKIANIKDFIEELTLSYNTKIGNEGIGISGGQKQRLLIARAIYKSPDYIFLDEATSALDANNENLIMNNLEQLFKDKTVVIIAHRLSTVKNADKIIVLNKGKIVEEGNHTELVAKKGEYYRLIKNQLELGN